MRKIVFSHRRALGDGLMFTAGIRDFKLLFPDIGINVDSNQQALWQNNPYIDTKITKGGKDVEYYKVGYPMIASVNNTNMHFSSMFLFDMIAVADLHKSLELPLGEFCSSFANGTVGDPPLGSPQKHKELAKEPFISLANKYRGFGTKFTRQRGDIHLSEKEKSYNLIQDIYGIDNYWVIAPGGKRDCTAKVWDWRKFQDVIDYYDGKIKFVVIGKSDLIVEKLDNVIDLTDKFNNDIRGLISVAYHSNGCVSGPSFLMHLAAALPPKRNKERKPCVSIFGGREPASWSWYCNHQILHTNGIFTCCDNGGCWKARTTPIPKDIKHNKNMCSRTVKRDGRTIQACMDVISSEDVIRAIGKYYEGNVYKYIPTPYKQRPKEQKHKATTENPSKEINVLGNLNTQGGGEQSLCTIVKCLRTRGWTVNFYPWDTVNDKFKNEKTMSSSYKNGMLAKMKPGLPLLFYANDCIWDFVKTAQGIVEKSSAVIIGINYCNGTLPRAEWLGKNPKLKAIVFQNTEKKEEFDRDAVGFENTQRVVLHGAIDLDSFIEVCPPKHDGKNDLVILKHCVSDYRKYVTKSSESSGDKIHLWQKHLHKENDIKFYTRLLKDTKNTRFEFMEAHKELVNAFPSEPRMVFHKWNSMKVTEFLKRGHIYLYRTSNLWRDQYPRVVAEALAVGMPILSEPRDGTKDRIIHGDTGFYCIDYDGFLYALKLLQRKEDYRYRMCQDAKDWARLNLNPNNWIGVIQDALDG